MIVVSDLHGSSVFLVLKSFDSEEAETFGLQGIQSPVGTDTNDVILFFETTAFIIIICDETSLVGGDGSETESWQLDDGETELVAGAGCVLDSVMVGSSGVGEGVVVGGPVLVEVDSVGVCLKDRSKDTSGKYHLAPCLAPSAIRSLVDTCWTAKGLTEATARLMDSMG